MASPRKKRGSVKLPNNVALEPEQQEEFEKTVLEIKNRGTGDVSQPGVVYIGHIPRGFFEPQMESFFSQFGKVTRLRMARSKRTGNSRGYAFVEFASEEVAKIVADTMNNYLMFEKLLKCAFLPKEKVHEALFKGCNRKFKRPKSHVNAIQRHNAVKSKAKQLTLARKTLSKQKKCFSKLAELGIDFTSDDITTNLSVKRNVKSPVPNTVKGKDGSNKAILWEDSTEEEISFKTPPNVIKSSKLTRTTSGSLKINMDDSVTIELELKKGKAKKVVKKDSKKNEGKVPVIPKVGEKGKLKSTRMKRKVVK
ncbi:MKI67 FHA domain-interacting nucleolar phosphoprotein-like [Haliotis rufescens]|uniref:MKI67 FHA domain-interacting nucleolar phosphoprotein-like n=1 Tax=Haliotis rufescens TaxID=6454 RepID=UPI001EB06561|nr:MKI67 FHA domain-interacting nucleolar phosphoprotein-like [Haliotis rufescens]